MEIVTADLEDLSSNERIFGSVPPNANMPGINDGNRESLIQVCIVIKLIVRNTYFSEKEIHKYTWVNNILFIKSKYGG